MGRPADEINSDSIEDDIYSNIHENSSSNLRNLKNQEENPERLNSDSIQDQEEGGSDTDRGNWANNTEKGNKTLKKAPGKLKFANASLKILKKNGAMSAIILLLISMLIQLMAFFVPGGLIVQLKEVVTARFNNQFTSMDIRSTNMLISKMNTTKGICGSKVTVKCKYSTMTEKQIKHFKDAGIEVVIDEAESKGLTGRSKVTGLTFKDKTIIAGGLKTEILKNPEFRSAMHKAYNPKYAGFSDKIWSAFAKVRKISKVATDIDGDTDEARLKKIQDATKGTAKNSKASTSISRDDYETDADYEKAVKAAADADKIANDIVDEAGDVSKSGIKAGTEVLDSVEDAAKKGLGSVSGTLGIAGFASSACTAYGSVQAVGYAAKTVRAAQLTSYAMIFLNVADQIKAGTAKAKDVEFLGKILTTEYLKSDGKKGKSATDSFGYKYAAYGDTGKMSISASQYLAGGGLTGELIHITDMINSATDNKPKKVCKVIGNPIVSGASLVAGIALMLIPGANVAFGAKDIAQAAFSIALSLASPTLITMLADIVAGVVIDKNTYGEASGDAIISGASGMMSGLAAMGGNAPLSPSEAVEYRQLYEKTAALYAEEDRLAYSPLDISNSNTFMGGIFSQLLPYLSKMSSVSGSISSIASLSTNSMAFATSQTAKAVTESDYTICKDFDYNDLRGDGNDTTDDKVATDPYCNVIYGIPSSYLNKDPIKVVEELGAEIDESTGDPKAGSNYATFKTDCIDRFKTGRSLGDSGADFSEDDGSKCKFSDKNANYYLHYIDQRVDSGYDGYDVSSGTSSTADSTIDIANLYKDSTSIACAAGTNDAGTADGYTDGTLVKIRVCTIPNTVDTDENLTASRMMTVNSRVSGAYLNLVNDLIKSTGQANLTINSSFRTPEMQQADVDQYGAWNGSTGAAAVGYGPHQMGIAIDYYTTTNDIAGKYGFHIPYPSETWHIQPKE